MSEIHTRHPEPRSLPASDRTLARDRAKSVEEWKATRYATQFATGILLKGIDRTPDIRLSVLQCIPLDRNLAFGIH